MSAKLVLDYYLEKYQSAGNTLIDVSFDNCSFLQSREPIYNLNGERVSKSYYDIKGREAVRITYNKVIGDYTYDNITYQDVFLGLQKTLCFLDWNGEIAYSKKMQGYYFTLLPVYKDGNITGFTSLKMRRILAVENYYANEINQVLNP